MRFFYAKKTTNKCDVLQKGTIWGGGGRHVRMLAQKKTWPNRAIQKWPTFLASRPKKHTFLFKVSKEKGPISSVGQPFFSTGSKVPNLLNN